MHGTAHGTVLYMALHTALHTALCMTLYTILYTAYSAHGCQERGQLGARGGRRADGQAGGLVDGRACMFGYGVGRFIVGERVVGIVGDRVGETFGDGVGDAVSEGVASGAGLGVAAKLHFSGSGFLF